MFVLPINEVYFDHEAASAMGAAFDQACNSLAGFAGFDKVRELIATRIIEAASNGERDPAILHSRALMGFSIDEVSVPIVSIAPDSPVPAYALITHVA